MYIYIYTYIHNIYIYIAICIYIYIYICIYNMYVITIPPKGGIRKGGSDEKIAPRSHFQATFKSLESVVFVGSPFSDPQTTPRWGAAEGLGGSIYYYYYYYYSYYYSYYY